jgi:hypothetical protein
MIYFKVTQTAPDHTGQMDIIENVVSQFDLQEHLINSKGVVNVEKVEQMKFTLFVYVVKRGHDSFERHTFFNKDVADRHEQRLLETKQAYKKFILTDKL